MSFHLVDVSKVVSVSSKCFIVFSDAYRVQVGNDQERSF